jgi:hypothetical protein
VVRTSFFSHSCRVHPRPYAKVFVCSYNLFARTLLGHRFNRNLTTSGFPCVVAQCNSVFKSSSLPFTFTPCSFTYRGPSYASAHVRFFQESKPVGAQFLPPHHWRFCRPCRDEDPVVISNFPNYNGPDFARIPHDWPAETVTVLPSQPLPCVLSLS